MPHSACLLSRKVAIDIVRNFTSADMAILQQNTCRFSKQNASFQKSIALVFNYIANDDFILPTKTSQRHLETRAANAWDLVQTDQSGVDIMLGGTNEALVSGPSFSEMPRETFESFELRFHIVLSKATLEPHYKP